MLDVEQIRMRWTLKQLEICHDSKGFSAVGGKTKCLIARATIGKRKIDEKQFPKNKIKNIEVIAIKYMYT